jgi:hypothetical protein
MFRHYYGLLCLQLLVYFIQVGLLDHLDMLTNYRDGLVDQKRPGSTSVSLSAYLVATVYRVTLDVEDTEKARCLVEHFSARSTNNRRDFLSAVGGFLAEDAEFLVRLLWEGRKMFLAVSAWTGESCRWSALFLALWSILYEAR